MNKEEKLEQVNHLVQKLGLSSKDICEYFSTRGIVNSAVIRKYETPKRVLPGMYVYADGLISAELITGRQVKAVVGYVEGKTVYAVCLKEKSLPWSSDRLEVVVSRDMTDGKDATRKILEISRKKRQEAEAAQWCYDYTYDGVIQGEAFLPLLEELKKLYVNKKAINESLSALNAKELVGWYWSSTEGNSNLAWVFSMSGGYRGSYGKYSYYTSVRPMITIQL